MRCAVEGCPLERLSGWAFCRDHNPHWLASPEHRRTLAATTTATADFARRTALERDNATETTNATTPGTEHPEVRPGGDERPGPPDGK